MLEPTEFRQSEAGRADVLDALFREHYLRLVRLAVQLVDDQASAEDVVQDVFARLQQGRQNFHELADRRRYLSTAVVNQARSTLRHRRVVRTRVLDHPQHVDGADAAVIHDATSATIWRAVTRLPTRQRQVVVLRFYENWTIPEIATALGISPGAASSSLDRALKSLNNPIGAINADR
ncbi:MAG: sigma-70 family RNA polymerase sigma factor [Actinomycetota bacterium]|nr:sigma-70 family RNA polymerase sigma factor [Actinomycetota bacterium]